MSITINGSTNTITAPSGLAIAGNTAVTGTMSATGAGTVGGLLDLSGASAGQIKFPATQNASADANTLDDYEEGTWTPVLTYETPGTLAVTYVRQLGIYTKIGRMVHFQLAIQLSAFTKGTASGVLRITGLPFTSTSNDSVAMCIYGLYDTPFTTQAAFSVGPSTAYINCLRLVNNSAWVSLDDPDSNSQYILSGTYFV